MDLFSRLFLTALLAVAPLCTWAQTYPVKPIRIISPFAPGGGNDVICRTVGGKLSESFKQQVIVDSRPGANGIVGTELTARAAPDGYTMVLIPSGHAVNASLYKKLPYDSIRDFTPIGLVGSSPLVLVVHPTLPVKNVKELIWFAQARPGQLTYASAGVGSSGHLAGALFDTLTGTKMVHVPYKGSALAQTDLIGGQVFLTFATSASVMGHVKAGRLRALASTGAKRPPALPDLPTVMEAGVSGYETGLWYAFIGPAGIPQDIVRRLNSEIVAALKTQDVRDRLTGVGVDAQPSTPEALGKLIASDIKRWAAVIEKTGIERQ
ncbi:MAG TPA: tripartite tricarboxylate transporter substrate binding protein [Burkholderiales bacterium]|nr:tripartite tricarboxylate transporter substrate binding protein [Burkholderiales bacterium]